MEIAHQNMNPLVKIVKDILCDLGGNNDDRLECG